MKQKVKMLACVALSVLLLFGCSTAASSSKETSSLSTVSSSELASKQEETNAPVTLLVAAAASLEYSFKDELIPLFTEQYPWITVEGTYDSSGKLQTQIEEGMQADVFMSAATKQMNALVEQGLVEEKSVVPLLENQIVLIVPKGNPAQIKSFEDIAKAESIAIGDPESVPAGQYAKEALTSLGLWDSAIAKASLGTNVTEVLNWVAEGSAEVGIVYATDAATSDKVEVITSAPEGSLEKKVIYPVGVVTASEKQEEARLFISFLQTEQAMKIFEKYGFLPNV